MRTAFLISCATCALLLSAGDINAQSTEAQSMERVTGIGGFFFRATDPKALADWYERHLGINRTPETYSQQPWEQPRVRQSSDRFGRTPNTSDPTPSSG